MRPCAVPCDAVQAEVDQQHQHIRSMIQQLQQQEQLMIADVRAAKVRAGLPARHACNADRRCASGCSDTRLP